MESPRHDYVLYVWREKPEDLYNLSHECWERHIRNAPAVPRIGELITSPGFIDDYGEYRVFDVKHDMGGSLPALITSEAGKNLEVELSDEEDHIPRVYAYDWGREQLLKRAEERDVEGS